MKDLLYIFLSFINFKFGLSHFGNSEYGSPYRGRYTGSCRGDGLYYRDSYSFVTCTHSIGYLQPCPPGTRNKKYQTYSARGGSQFCTENLVNFGYTIYNQHPLHGPRSLKSKPKRYLDRQRGYSQGRIHRPYRLFTRYKRPPRPLVPPKPVYARPEGRMYRGPVEESEFPNPDMQYHHTGPEFHGPYRDQAKDTPKSFNSEKARKTENSHSHGPAERHADQEPEPRNEKMSVQREIVFAKPDSEYENQGRIPSRNRGNFLRRNHELGGNVQIKRKENQRQHRYSVPDRHLVTPPKIRMDLTRIKLLPQPEEREPPQRLIERPRPRPNRHYPRGNPDFKVSPRLLELKKKILEKYLAHKQKHFVHPIYEQYTSFAPKGKPHAGEERQRAREGRRHPRGERGPSPREERHPRGYSSGAPSDTRRRREAFRRFGRALPLENDRPKKPEDGEKLLMTIIGVGDKIIGYNQADDRNKIQFAENDAVRHHDWRSEMYNVQDHTE